MSISRKEFFRQGFISLGKTALNIAGTLKGGEAVEAAVILDRVPSGEPRPDMAAAPFNERCLARNCGCFACVERCQIQAIMVVPGEGIRIDETRCTGCGTCEYVCPVNPKAVILQPRAKPAEIPAMNETPYPRKENEHAEEKPGTGSNGSRGACARGASRPDDRGQKQASRKSGQRRQGEVLRVS